MSEIIPIYQVDAFAKGPFSGNPAAVCPLDQWLPDATLQSIAEENNLSETAFVVKEGKGYRIRWFTPTVEVKLCGHATLATGFVFFEKLGHPDDQIEFNCLSGKISVSRNENRLTLDFPIDHITPVECPDMLLHSLNIHPMECYKASSDYLLVYDSEEKIKSLQPNFDIMSRTPGRGCIVTARGAEEFDTVCRGFFPQSGINEDPATGSAQTTLAAYWPEQLSTQAYTCCQLSNRKGFFRTSVHGDRVKISGQCRLYLEGKIYL